MLRRIIAIVVVVLGLGIIGAAVASATVWRPSDEVTLRLPADPDASYVMTEPGVLDAVDDNVTVTLTGADEDTPLILAMGHESDVVAWLGDSPYWRVTGLSDWETLSYEPVDAATEEPSDDASEEPSDDASADPSEGASDDGSDDSSDDAPADADGEDEPDPNADPSGSDLWIEETDGAGELTYDWTRVPGRWSMLVATDGTAPAPQVALTWQREVTTPLFVPGLIVGGVVLLLGLLLLVLSLLADAEARRSRRALAEAGVEPEATTFSAEADHPLTRREIRLAEQAAKLGKGKGRSVPPVPEQPAQPEQGESAEPDDETAVIPAVGADDASEHGEQASPASSGPDAADERIEAPVGGHDDLAGWFSSGATSAAGAGAPAEGADSAQDPAAPEGGSADAPAKPRRWWQRRRRNAGPDEAGATADQPDPEPTAQEPDDVPAQASGASWRATWGLGAPGADEATASIPAVPADAETASIPAVGPETDGAPDVPEGTDGPEAADGEAGTEREEDR